MIESMENVSFSLKMELYVHGKKEGLWLLPCVNDRFYSKGNFIGGIKEGIWEIYFKNGILESKQTFEHGERIKIEYPEEM